MRQHYNIWCKDCGFVDELKNSPEDLKFTPDLIRPHTEVLVLVVSGDAK